MTPAPQQQPQWQADDGLDEAVVASIREEMMADDSSKSHDILEIIEELSDDERDPTTDCSKDNKTDTQDTTESTTEEDDSFSSPDDSSSFDFSLSSIKFVLGDATAKVGNATVGKLRQSFSHLPTASLPKDGTQSMNNNNNSSHHSALLRSKLQRRNSSPAKMTTKVDFGEFQDRAVRLQYTVDDIFEIVDDPAQFNELRDALRSLGAVTNTIIKQKIHWYVKNNKRERALLLQEQQKQEQTLDEPCTPLTETKVMDRNKVIQGVDLNDISPKSVRGIFVPSS